MMYKRFAVAVAAISILATSALATTNLTGEWKGKLSFNQKPTPGMTDQQKQMMATQLDGLKKVVFGLNMAKNGTFTISITGFPGMKKPLTQKGTWTLKGDQLTMTQGTTHPQVFTVAKNGKSFAATQMGGASIKFTR